MSVDRIYEKFGLRARPFSVTPDPNFLLWTKQHARAFATLEYGLLVRSPISLLTGEVGSGKTTLLQALLNKVENDYTIGLVTDPQGTSTDLFAWILKALSVDVSPSSSLVEMVHALQDFFIAEYAAGRRVLLCFDEGQNLSFESLEALRMLTNVNANGHELLHVILAGQPELRGMVKEPRMLQLAQRITVGFHLQPLESETLHEYVVHRLQIAGGTGKEFSKAACDVIYEASRGVPRLINQLCDFSMLYAWSAGHDSVDAPDVENVLRDGVFFALEIGKEGTTH